MKIEPSLITKDASELTDEEVRQLCKATFERIAWSKTSTMIASRAIKVLKSKHIEEYQDICRQIKDEIAIRPNIDWAARRAEEIPLIHARQLARREQQYRLRARYASKYRRTRKEEKV